MAQVVDPQELVSLYRTWDTAELAVATGAEADTYSPAALELLRQELERRGKRPAELEAAVSSARLEDRAGLRGVKGFLALMVVDIATRSLWNLAGFFNLLAGGAPRILGLFGLVLALTGLAGLAVCLLVLRKDRRAPRAAAAWFVLVAATIAAFFLYNRTHGGQLNWFAVLFFYPLLWLPYLRRSKRVKATFGPPPEPPPDLAVFD